MNLQNNFTAMHALRHNNSLDKLLRSLTQFKCLPVTYQLIGRPCYVSVGHQNQ